MAGRPESVERKRARQPFGFAAGCAFYALFAAFPVLSTLIALYGLTADPASVDLQVGMLAAVRPTQAYDMVIDQIRRVAETSSRSLGWGLALSLGLAVWSVSNLTQAMFAALNIAYEEPERRSLLRFYLSAFSFAVLGIASGVLMLLAIVYVPILFAYAGYSETFELVVRVARWPLLALFVLVLLALLYRYGPCRRSAKWRWVSLGSVFATVVWLGASAGFSFYVAHFSNYDRTYGSLGAVIVLLFCGSGRVNVAWERHFQPNRVKLVWQESGVQRLVHHNKRASDRT